MSANKELTSTRPSPPVESRDLAQITREKVQDFLKTFGLADQLNDQEREQFIQLAREFQLNPFKRELHCVPYGENGQRRLNIIVGYEVYIKRADRGGKLDGWKVWIEGDGEGMKAVIEIHRKDWENSFMHEVYWKEVVQRRRDGTITSFWSKMPRFQLKKVAISQGFRLCFPDELGGMPYEAAELPLDEEPAQDERPMRVVSPPREEESEPQEPSPNPGMVVPEGKTAFNVLDEYLLVHHDSINQKHAEWIKSQVASRPTMEKIQQMYAYAQRVVSGEPSPTRQAAPNQTTRFRIEQSETIPQ